VIFYYAALAASPFVLTLAWFSVTMRVDGGSSFVTLAWFSVTMRVDGGSSFVREGLRAQQGGK